MRDGETIRRLAAQLDELQGEADELNAEWERLDEDDLDAKRKNTRRKLEVAAQVQAVKDEIERGTGAEWN